MTAHVPHADEANAWFQLVAFCIHHKSSFCNRTKRHATEMCQGEDAAEAGLYAQE
jgi:hypothetical protein